MENITREDTCNFLRNFESGLYDNNGRINRYTIEFILNCVKKYYDDEIASKIVSKIIKTRIRNRFDLCDEMVLRNAYGDLLFIDESINNNLSIVITSDNKIDCEFMDKYFDSLNKQVEVVKSFFIANDVKEKNDEISNIFIRQQLDLRDLERETLLSPMFKEKVLKKMKIIDKEVVKKRVYKNAIAY